MNAVLQPLRPDAAALLVVDVQDRLLPVIHEADACVDVIGRMMDAAAILGIPLVVTEQYPRGLGHTCDVLRGRFGGVTPFEKTRFSACVEPVVNRLRELGRPQVIVTGIEAHVCVQQTVLDLLRLGFTPYLCADAVSSRRVHDRDLAVARMRQAGAIISAFESIVYELMGEAGTDTFKQILRLVK